ncbi:hypothetical protein [Mesorhizobium sp. ANAO-SY3R2]|uniref:hypothetical protein n=1 Tax=Mesorhizobium sp. ANAO-SY3R2 TaxID=3166644 RepID=UPI00366F91B9
MRANVAVMSILLATGPAVASGGLSCGARDGAVKFTIESGITRGMGSPVFDLHGQIEIFDKAVAEDLRRVSFDSAHLAQYWLDGEELRMIVYRERDADKPHGYVEVIVKTKSGEDGDYIGQYSVTVFDMAGAAGGEGKTFNYSGRATCLVE